MAVNITGGTVSPSTALSTNGQTGTSYTLALTDANNTMVELSNVSGIALTVPTNSTAAFPVGSQIHIMQTNSGQVTVAGAGGVTLNGTPGLKLRTQWSVASLVKRGTDTWVLFGDVTN